MTDTEIDVPELAPPELKREKTLKVDKVDKVLKTRKSNKWVAHVRSVSEAKKISYKEALKEAKLTYNKTE
jgi:hypothetical protein